jgi:SulP family sulfate permease
LATALQALSSDAFTPKLVSALREGYDQLKLRADAFAGLTVAIVALPLAMALGIASGAGPKEGLVTAVVAGVLISALGAVLLMVAWGMSEADRFVALVRTDAGERAILILTFLLTILVDLTVAIGVGVTLAALLFMTRMSETAGLVAIDVAEEPELRAALPEGVEVFRFTGPLFFGVASEMLEALRRMGQRPRAIILRMERVPYIDATGANALATFVLQARHGGTDVWLCGLKPGPREFLARTEPPFAGARHVAKWSTALKTLKKVSGK